MALQVLLQVRQEVEALLAQLALMGPLVLVPDPNVRVQCPPGAEAFLCSCLGGTLFWAPYNKDPTI